MSSCGLILFLGFYASHQLSVNTCKLTGNTKAKLDVRAEKAAFFYYSYNQVLFCIFCQNKSGAQCCPGHAVNLVTDCFTSCQERQKIVVTIKRKQVLPVQSSLMSSLFFILIYFVEDPFESKETGVMRNLNLHYDLFLICSCALLSKITHYLFLHGLNRHGCRCLWNAKCERNRHILFCHFDFFSLA